MTVFDDIVQNATIDAPTGGSIELRPAARSARALSSVYDDLGSRLGRAERRTEVSSLFVAAAGLALAVAAGLSRVGVPGLR